MNKPKLFLVHFPDDGSREGASTEYCWLVEALDADYAVRKVRQATGMSVDVILIAEEKNVVQ